MIRTLATGMALAALMGGAAFAETFEVKMLNKGADGERMVFEPAFVQAALGDTIKFIAANKGHNAETAKDMIPEGPRASKARSTKRSRSPSILKVSTPCSASRTMPWAW